MLEEIEAAGLLDPSAPDAEYRTVIAQQLLDVGLSVADVIAILEADDVEHAMNSRLLFPGPRLEKLLTIPSSPVEATAKVAGCSCGCCALRARLPSAARPA